MNGVRGSWTDYHGVGVVRSKNLREVWNDPMEFVVECIDEEEKLLNQSHTITIASILKLPKLLEVDGIGQRVGCNIIDQMVIDLYPDRYQRDQSEE